MNKNCAKNKNKLDLCESSEDECSNDEACYLSGSEIYTSSQEISEDSDSDTSIQDSEEESNEDSDSDTSVQDSEEESDEEELTLLDFLSNYNIRISKNGLINLRDFVNKVILSKNPELYIKKIIGA